MKKVVLLGDSIRLGYGKVVEEKLGDEFTLWQPKDNCRFAAYTLRGIYDWRANIDDSDVIHWNNGHWDICDLFGDGAFTSVEDYVALMVRVAKLLQARCKVLIFATTTPVRNNYIDHNNQDIEKYNQALVPELEKLGVVINDLYTPVHADVDRYICDDLIHLSSEGIAMCAELVASTIRREAEKL